MKLAPPMGMKLGIVLALLLVSPMAMAKRKDKQKAKPAPAPTKVEPAPVQTTTEAKPAEGAKAPKVKVYSFTGLDVEGKLKTPQLLYFLNRIKAEFDTSTLDKRSFMPELEASADDKAL